MTIKYLVADIAAVAAVLEGSTLAGWLGASTHVTLRGVALWSTGGTHAANGKGKTSRVMDCRCSRMHSVIDKIS